MVVITVDMWPGGNKEKAYILGRTYIWNTGVSKDKKLGDYKVAVMRKGKEDLSTHEDNVTRFGEVNSYPRESYNMWRLIIRALKSAFPEEK